MSRSFSSGYIVGGAFTVLALPVLFALRRVGGRADEMIGDSSVEGTCPAGLPRVTQIESHPVPALVGED